MVGKGPSLLNSFAIIFSTARWVTIIAAFDLSALSGSFVVVVDVNQLLCASHNSPSSNSTFKTNTLTMGTYLVSYVDRCSAVAAWLSQFCFALLSLQRISSFASPNNSSLVCFQKKRFENGTRRWASNLNATMTGYDGLLLIFDVSIERDRSWWYGGGLRQNWKLAIAATTTYKRSTAAKKSTAPVNFDTITGRRRKPLRFILVLWRTQKPDYKHCHLCLYI